MKRLFVIPALAVTALALAVPAHAQSPGWRDSDRLGYAQRSYLDARQAAYDNGFREGIKRGENDGRRNNAFAFQDERTFQRADKGYHREYGPLDRYRVAFRSGYSAGYSDGYQRYARNYGYGPDSRRDSRGPAYSNAYPVYPNTYPRLSAVARLRQPGIPERRERRVREGRRGRAQEPVVRPAPPLLVSLRRSPLRRPLREPRIVQGHLPAGIHGRLRPGI